FAGAQSGSVGRPADAIAAGVFSTGDTLREAAVAAASVLSTKTYQRAREPLPVPDGPLNVRDVLSGLSPNAFTPVEAAPSPAPLGPAAQRAAVAAVATSPDRARVVADALLSRDKGLGLAPFTDATVKLPDKLAREVDAVVESIAAASVPGFA